MIRSFRTYVFTLGIATIIASFFIYHYTSKTTVKNNKTYHGIIFDLDGTIIDTDPLWKQATFCVLEEHAQDLPTEKKEAFITSCQNLGVYETVVRIMDYLEKNEHIKLSSDDIFKACMPYLKIIYQQQGIEFIPHFHTFYEQVLAQGLKTAIATSSQEHIVNLVTDIVPLRHYFSEHIYHADHVNKAYKPRPDVYLHAAEKICIQPCHCIAIEDSSTGIKAAKAAGMYCIGINTAGNKAALHLADEIVDSYLDINLDNLLYKTAENIK